MFKSESQPILASTSRSAAEAESHAEPDVETEAEPVREKVVLEPRIVREVFEVEDEVVK